MRRLGVPNEKMSNAKNGIDEIFTSFVDGIGTENKTFKNFKYADAVDILNRDDEMLSGYKYLIDLSGDEDFKDVHKNTVEISDLKEKFSEVLPCNVEGDVHWLINECTSGGFYLTVFNHDGVNRSVAEGEGILEEATVD